MAFDVLETFTRANAPPEATISYDYAQRKGTAPKGDKKPRLTISIPTTMCGTSKSETFQLLIGSGDDTGKLLIRGVAAPAGGRAPPKDAPKVGVVPSQHAHFFRWNFGFVPRLGDDTFAGEKCPVRKVSDESFEITVPKSWFAPPAKND